ncbi:MAG: hypothetical protein RL264_1273 [Bacteroidota bacterium]|jgi:hypothetical protein
MMKFIISSFGLILHLSIFSQQIVRSNIGSFGNSKTNDGITLQQTIGQPALVNHVNVDGTGLRQGFQQPIYFVEEQNDLNVTLYPNPNQGEFSFIVEESSEIKLQYQLFDQQGKLIFQGKTDANVLTPISIQNPTPGMYHLKVNSDTKVSSFKVNVIH